jgi:arylsulfatase A-like enzyme
MVFSETGMEGEPSGAPAGGQQGGAPARPRAPWQGTAPGRMKMVRSRDWKYVHDPAGEHELYDLAADPYELVNLVERPEQRERVQELRSALLDWCIESEDRLPVAQRTPDRGL